jgi:hypothetical protein
MEETQKLRLLYRQLKDIQSQADKIIRDNGSLEDLEQFEGYSRELRKFILDNYPDREVVQTVLEIPAELYKVNATDIGLMAGVVAFIPGFSSFMRERRRIQQSIETVHLIRGKYSTLEFLIKSKY